MGIASNASNERLVVIALILFDFLLVLFLFEKEVNDVSKIIRN